MAKVTPRSLMRHIIYLPFLALLAASEGDPSPLSATVLLHQLGHLQNISKISADFEQIRTVKEWGTEVKTSGSFVVIKKDHPQVLWQIKKPSPTAMKMQGQKLMIQVGPAPASWTFLDNPKVVSQMQNIFAWLSMDTQQISKDFTVSQPRATTFLLKPKNKESIFKSIAIHMNSKKLVEKIEMKEHGDDSIVIHFTNTVLTR